MQFRAEEYYQASLERMRQALALQRETGSSALAMYCGGLAVECLLRAFRWTKDTRFEGRHDLAELFRASGILAKQDEFMRGRGASAEEVDAANVELQVSISEIVAIWHNYLRFASEASLKAHLKRLGRLRGSKGNPLKRNACALLKAAQTVIRVGMQIWTSNKKSPRR